MLGLFGTLNLGSRAMQVQMTGVQTAGQNIANVNTPGYTRQRVDIVESQGLLQPGGEVGTGSQVAGIARVVSDLLNSQIQSNGSNLGYQQGLQTALQGAENSLGEFLSGTANTTSTNDSTGTNSSGLSSQLSDLFNAFQAVATSPGSISARQSLIGAAQSLATTFNQVNRQFSQLNTSLNQSVSDGVTSANQLLSSIAGLNQQITSMTAAGGNANDLLDKRELDLENLSKLTNFTTSTDAQGDVNVTISGETLVSGRQLTDTLQTYTGSNGNLLVQTATGGVNLTLTGGSIQGTIDARDQDLAGMQTQLNSLASNLITSVNTVHSGGFSLTGTSGANFFNGTGASNITVNQALVNDPSLIQASGSATAAGDNSVALQLAQLASTAQSGLNNQTYGDYYDSTVANLGTALNSANTQVTNQQAVANMLSTQRGSISGVNLDEEMTNLMSFQQAYTASTELVKTVDQMLQTTLAMKT